MAAIEFLRGHEVFKVLVICPDFERMGTAFEEVTPFVQRAYDRKHLLVVYFVISLDRAEAFRQEGDRMPFTVLLRLLRKDSSRCEVRTIGFDAIGKCFVRQDKDRG